MQSVYFDSCASSSRGSLADLGDICPVTDTKHIVMDENAGLETTAERQRDRVTGRLKQGTGDRQIECMPNAGVHLTDGHPTTHILSRRADAL